MKVLFVSEKGSLLPLAVRVKKEGHNVLLFNNDIAYKKVGSGMVNVSEMRGSLTLGSGVNKGLLGSLLEFDPDFVVCDGDRLGNVSGEIHKVKPVFGSDKTIDRLINSKAYFDTVMKVISVNSKNENTQKDDYTLGFWFDGKDTYLHNISVIQKCFMDNEVGKDIEDSGHTTIMIPKDNKNIVDIVSGLTKFLKQTMYKGSIRLSISKGQIIDIKTCMDYALLELYRGSIIDLLQGFALGRVKHYELHNGVALTVRLSIPPFPNGGDNVETSIKFEEGAKKHLWLSNIKKVNDNYTCFANIGFVTAGASTIKYCRERVYRTIDRLEVKDLQYRSDIGINAGGVFNGICEDR